MPPALSLHRCLAHKFVHCEVFVLIRLCNPLVPGTSVSWAFHGTQSLQVPKLMFATHDPGVCTQKHLTMTELLKVLEACFVLVVAVIVLACIEWLHPSWSRHDGTRRFSLCATNMFDLSFLHSVCWLHSLARPGSNTTVVHWCCLDGHL